MKQLQISKANHSRSLNRREIFALVAMPLVALGGAAFVIHSTLTTVQQRSARMERRAVCAEPLAEGPIDKKTCKVFVCSAEADSLTCKPQEKFEEQQRPNQASLLSLNKPWTVLLVVCLAAALAEVSHGLYSRAVVNWWERRRAAGFTVRQPDPK